MIRVFRYKLSYLLSSPVITVSTAALFFLLNFSALVNSGVLLSGGAEFNAETKYMLLMNNYISVALFYGLLFSMILGANTLGPDAQSGNLNILMSAYPSRVKYFMGTILISVLCLTSVQLLMSGNMILLLKIYEIPFVWHDIQICTIQILLDSLVILSVTAVGSIFMKGLRSVIVGLVGYSFYNIYMFNTIPFINGALIFPVSQYKNILCHFFPVIRVMTPSYTEEATWSFYKLHTILPSAELYQVLYIVLVMAAGCILFQKRDLK